MRPSLRCGGSFVVRSTGLGGVTGAKPKMLSEETRRQSAVRLGNKLFIHALTNLVPVSVLLSLL